MRDAFESGVAPEIVASPEIEAAVDDKLGALLRDRDVDEVSALEGGFLDVIRRGKREKLDAVLESPLFQLVRDQGADARAIVVRLKSGARLHGAPLVDGRTALRVEKHIALDATLDRLVEEGLLPPGIGAEFVASVVDGAGVLVLGPSRSGRQRVVGAIVRALQGRLTWFGASDALSSLVPVTLDRNAPIVERARACVALGADAIAMLEIDAHDVASIARASLGVPVVASVTSSSMDALRAHLNVGVDAIAGQSAVVAHGPDGRPRLIEVHGPMRSDVSAASNGEPAHHDAVTLTSRGAAPASAPPISSPLRPAEVSGLRARPAFTSSTSAPTIAMNGEEPLPPLPELPASWASNEPHDDPGWELGDPVAPEDAMTPSAPLPASSASNPANPSTQSPLASSSSSSVASGSFDAALAAQKKRPTFAPRPPQAHPQASTLRGDPFGGLTFEPPPGGPPDDELGDTAHVGDDGDEE